MTPRQLSPQRGDNHAVREYLGEAQRVSQRLLAKPCPSNSRPTAATIRAVFRAAAIEHLPADALIQVHRARKRRPIPAPP